MHPALALDFDLAPWLETILVTQPSIGRLSDLDPSGDAARFHPARRVNRVAPDVVREAPATDDGGNRGTDVDADPKADAPTPLPV